MKISKKVNELIQFTLSCGYNVEVINDSISFHNEKRGMVINESGFAKCDGVARIIKSGWEIKEFLLASAK